MPGEVRKRIVNMVNVLGTLNILQAARDAGVKRLVYASSSSIYGHSAELPKRETMCPNPLSPYAISKLSGEQYCRVFWQLYGFETVCLRYFNVFGPRQDPTSQYSAVIPKFISAMLKGKEITIYGDGTQSRDFTFIANVGQANLPACTAPDAAGGVFNIACGERSLLDLAARLVEITGQAPQACHTDPRPGDVPHSQADISQAQARLGYDPQVDLAAGLSRTVEWFKGRNEPRTTNR